MKSVLQIINTSLLAEKQPINSIKSAKIISERRLSLYDWLLRLLNEARAEVIAADDMPMMQLLQNFGQRRVDMCLVFTDGRTGVNLVTTITERINEFRSLLPNIGVLIVSMNGEAYINPNLLPVRSWLVTPQTQAEDINDYLLECRFACSNNSFSLRSVVTDSFMPVVQDNEYHVNWLLPNFNIKHPGMLLPIAKAALKNSTPVYVEISPQEALVYYPNQEKDIYKRIERVFLNLKADVEWVKQQTGAKIFLHLDHCNDAEIIKRALDAGFNSIMADGSNQTLSENIRFVQAIIKLAEPYNVPVEGEVGAIDLSGYRKKSTTLCSELDIFVEATGAAYVGVNVRQFHGCDYGFERSREAYLKHREFVQKQYYSSLLLLQSCFQIDNLLNEKGYSIHSLERIKLKQIIDAITQSKEEQIPVIISSFMSEPSIFFNYFLNEIIKEWHMKKGEMIDENQKLLEQVLGFGMKHDSGKEKSLDFELLALIAKSLKGTNTNMVLHGGSSIAKDELQFLNSYGVKRVNLGSKPFQLFINSLRAKAFGKYNYGNTPLSYNPLETTFFVNEFASDWKSWFNNNPSSMLEYEYELDTLFFKPLNKNRTI
jgi:fructose/tagatose bisphosphate aldolase